MTNKMKLPALLALAVTGSMAINAHAAKLELLLSGPVENVNAGANSVTVLGHVIQTQDASRVVKGELVNVYGQLLADGTVADALIESTASYIPGADEVFIKGVVTSSNLSIGTLQVGTTQIDYTNMLAQDFNVPTAGQVIQFSGTQPAWGGVVLASGTSLRLATVDDSGVKSAISNGSGVRSAISNGSGVRSAISNGSGVRSAISNGSGVRSAISNGSGVRSAISNGSGVRSAISNGSGVRSAISNGSGVRSAISNGSGVRSAISNGSGVRSAISNGSGVRSAISNGSGVRSAISNGSGVRSAISNGSGVGFLSQ